MFPCSKATPSQICELQQHPLHCEKNSRMGPRTSYSPNLQVHHYALVLVVPALHPGRATPLGSCMSSYLPVDWDSSSGASKRKAWHG